MDLRVIFLLITTGANLALAIAILFKNWRDRVNITFSLMLISIASWSFWLALFYWVPTADQVQATLAPIYSSAAFISLFFNYFTLYFPFILVRESRLKLYFKLIATFIIIAIAFIGGIETDVIFRPDHDHLTKINYLNYFFFSLYFSYLILESFVRLYKKIKVTASYQRKLAVTVFSSTLIAAIFGSIFNLIIPVFTYRYVWVGPLFTVIMVFIVARLIFIESK